VAVVLREAAHAHEAVQRARGLVAVAGAEFAVAQRQVAVAAQALVEDLHVPGQFIGFTANSRFSTPVKNMFSL
jgi:hypothetical protein